MTIALVLLTDGRDELLEKTITSAERELVGPITERWIFDDTGDDAHRKALAERLPRFTVKGDGPRRGFGGTIHYAWETLLDHSLCDFVFHCEDDFTFNRAVDLWAMMDVLAGEKHLLNLVLRRQPWNDDERRAGGIVEMWPQEYEDCSFGRYDWLEHRLFWSTNPGLYRSSLMEKGWPKVDRSERAFTDECLKDPAARFGYWGARDSGEWVTHIGDERAGTGY